MPPLRLLVLPVMAGMVLWADLAKQGYLQFGVPLPGLRGEVWVQASGTWQHWRADGFEAIAPTDDRLQDCEQVVSDRPISKAQYVELKDLLGQTTGQVATVLGNPVCLLAEGELRYLGEFLSHKIDLQFDEEGRLIGYDLQQ